MSQYGHQPTQDGTRLATEVGRDIAAMRHFVQWHDYGKMTLTLAASVVSPGSSSVNVRCPGVRIGKMARACFTKLEQPVGTVLEAAALRVDTVRVTFLNISGVTISMGDVEVRIAVER